MTGKTYCCPDAASGHASVEPPSVAMNFRLAMLIAIDFTIGRHTFEVRNLLSPSAARLIVGASVTVTEPAWPIQGASVDWPRADPVANSGGLHNLYSALVEW